MRTDTLGKRRDLAVGEYLCLQGEEPRHFFILIEGAVDVVAVKDLQGQVATEADATERGTVITRLDKPNVFLGEVGAFLGYRTSSLRAAAQTAVLAVPLAKDNVLEAIRANPSFGLTLAETIARRLRDNDARIEQTAHSLSILESSARSAAHDFYTIVNALARRGDLFDTDDESHPLSLAVKHARETATYAAGETEAELRHQDDSRLTEIVKTLGGTRELKADEMLMREGEAINACYIVVSGHLAVTIGGMRVGTISRGETVGELGCLLPELEHRTATVRAMVATKIAVIEQDTFQETMLANPDMLMYLDRTLASRLDHSNAVLIDAEGAFRVALEGLYDSPMSIGAQIDTLREALVKIGEEQGDLQDSLTPYIDSLQTWLDTIDTLFDSAFE